MQVNDWRDMSPIHLTHTPPLAIAAPPENAPKCAGSRCNHGTGHLVQCAADGCSKQYHPLCAWYDGAYLKTVCVYMCI